MKMRKRKLTLLIMLCVLALGSISAYAGTRSTNLHADHGDATATITTTFRNRLFGNDDATASTTFVTNNGNYRVAVRLEWWDEKAMIGYGYQNGKESCSVAHSHSDVGSYRSRHSIDNSNNTVEYEAYPFYIHE